MTKAAKEPDRREMPPPPPLRQAEFFRERTTMCATSPKIVGGALGGMFKAVFGDAAKQATDAQVDAAAAALWRVLRGAQLLLVTEPLLGNAEDAVGEMSDDELAALPPLPADTVFGFAEPRIFEIVPDEPETISVVIPINSMHLPFKDEPAPAFVGYGRLADFEYIYRKYPTASGTHQVLKELRAHQQLWMPTMVMRMDMPMRATMPNNTMQHVLAAALARAKTPTDTPMRRPQQQHATNAGVKRRASRSVRTVELAPRYRTSSDTAGTGKPLQWRSTTRSHDRIYRNPDGSVRKVVRIDEFTRAGDKPPRPPEQQPGTVKVAREPKGTT